jgi:pimeloyl-ACP methyl ester carboxylesterase
VCVLFALPSRGRLPGSTGNLLGQDYGVAFAYVIAARQATPAQTGGFAVLKAFAAGRLFGAASGDGQPWVLALHGWRRSHRDFDAVLAGVAAIAVDLPGFGATPPPPEAWSTRQYAESIAPILDECAGGVVVVGHSFGGRVATHLAAQCPERVAALVLTGVPLVAEPGRLTRKPPLAFRAGRTLHRRGVISDRRMEMFRQRYGSADYRAAEGVMRGVLVQAVNETYETPLAAYPGPVELVWGQDDREVVVAVAEAASKVGADATLTLCPGAGHLVPTVAPDCLRQAILRHRPAGIPE